MTVYRFILKSGVSFSLAADRLIYGQSMLDVYTGEEEPNHDILIYLSELAAVVPEELLLDEKESTTS